MVNRRLGRGLDAIIPPRVVDTNEHIVALPTSQLQPNPDQPRQHFDQATLQELARSIESYGVIQPIVVCKKGAVYEIIAGERRFQASMLAGKKQIPAIIRDESAQRRLELALVENIQRESLSPLEEAKTFKRLTDEFNMTLREIADQVGKQVPTISNKIRLLELPETVRQGLSEGKISEGHARALLGLHSPQLIELGYGQILQDKLNVREVEAMVRDKLAAQPDKPASTNRVGRPLQSDTTNQRQLEAALGTKVNIRHKGNRGVIELHFYSEEERDRLIQALLTIED